MARFFIVQEVMDNPDGFNGSFYLHKPYGEDSRWKAGPLWDILSYDREKTDYTFRMKAAYVFRPRWIGELLKYNNFREAVVKVWYEFYPSRVHEFFAYIDEACSPEIYAEAYKTGENQNLYSIVPKTKAVLQRNIEWFNNHLPQLENAVGYIAENCQSGDSFYTLQGLRLSSEPEHGIFIKNGKIYIKR